MCRYNPKDRCTLEDVLTMLWCQMELTKGQEPAVKWVRVSLAQPLPYTLFSQAERLQGSRALTG